MNKGIETARIYEDAKYQPSISSFLQYSKAVSLTQFVKNLYIVRMCLQTFFLSKVWMFVQTYIRLYDKTSWWCWNLDNAKHNLCFCCQKGSIYGGTRMIWKWLLRIDNDIIQSTRILFDQYLLLSNYRKMLCRIRNLDTT